MALKLKTMEASNIQERSGEKLQNLFETQSDDYSITFKDHSGETYSMEDKRENRFDGVNGVGIINLKDFSYDDFIVKNRFVGDITLPASVLIKHYEIVNEKEGQAKSLDFSGHLNIINDENYKEEDLSEFMHKAHSLPGLVLPSEDRISILN